MKKFLLLFLATLAFCSCSNDDEPSAEQIVGEWKLMEIRTFDLESNLVVDYSDETIIFDFSPGGKLMVSGGENVDYPDGEYDYTFGMDHLGGSNEGQQSLLVKIDGAKWTYHYGDGLMTLSKAYVDGPTMILKRI